ncbi:Glyoxalase/Bleomycin resistance protein/Dioxygenase superfamily protein [Caballeronia arationis]|uniref:Glyoxalase/Bleomycin resistance protein/Dioxygenase superfamily protein n=1 Tax=Caballeronia arationis TaxID=1777142 RepID=A0A7Z7I784_9BURK|nr:VOC family protein [Caballeronia arationis]SOE80554.1 Glyoxalase/Bleomycin resistance protein/Dioxygenase superfamily protein [Caballeronia arationis]
MQLDHATIVAPECEAMKRFFVDVAGMTLGARPPFGVGGYWLYLGGRPVVHLIASRAASDAHQASTRIDHLALRVDGVEEWEALLGRLHRHGTAYQLAEVPLTGELQLFVQLAPAVVVEFVTTRA